MQREYGRLSITGTVLSKRKILKLVNEGYVRGWDDPRMFTLIGIKRRGVPPGAILEFINELGVTTAPSVWPPPFSLSFEDFGSKFINQLDKHTGTNIREQ